MKKLFLTHKVGLVALLMALMAPALFAQAPLTPHDVAQIRSVGSAVLSPDGGQVAYILSVPRTLDEPNGSAWTELHVASVADGTSRGFITGAGNVSGIAWTPDGMYVSFLTQREGDTGTSLYRIPVNGGEAQKVVGLDYSISSYQWNADASQVAMIVSKPTGSKEKYAPIIYEEENADRSVWIATPGTDAAPRKLNLDGAAFDLAWSPGGSRLAVTLAPTSLVDDRYMERRVHIVNAETGEVRATVNTTGKLGTMAWSNDGRHIALIAGANLNDPKEGRLMVADSRTGAFTDIFPNLEGHVSRIGWAKNRLHYIADEGVYTRYATADADGGNGKDLVGTGGPVLTNFSTSADGMTTVFVAQSPMHPSEVYVMGANDEAPRRLTNSNPWLAEKALARQEVIKYEARDGLEIEGMLIHPLNKQEGTRVPLIMVVHGGPEAHYRNGWLTSYSSPGQMAAGEGYAVFYPNYRGSTGRGLEYALTSQGDPAGKEFDDLVDGVDYLIDTGLVDRDKVGVTGGSYGGYATGWLSTKYSDRFAAGVMFVGISNKISKVGTTDIPDEEYHVHARKRPWDNWEMFLDRSPIFHAGNGQTPLLILHGQDDPRVNVGQSRELYRHLKIRGKAPVRLVLYPGEQHGNRRARARLDYNLRAMRWLNHYLMGPGGEKPAHKIDLQPMEAAVEG